MIRITYQESQDLLSNCNVGYYCHSEGIPAKNGAPSVVGLQNGEIYLFMPEEIGNEQWNELMEKQVEELIDFLDKET
jgi:hypothetical protein